VLVASGYQRSCRSLACGATPRPDRCREMHRRRSPADDGIPRTRCRCLPFAEPPGPKLRSISSEAPVSSRMRLSRRWSSRFSRTRRKRGRSSAMRPGAYICLSSSLYTLSHEDSAHGTLRRERELTDSLTHPQQPGGPTTMTLAAARPTSGFARSGVRSTTCDPTSGASRVLPASIAASRSWLLGRRRLHMSQMLRRHAWGV
jgi:hypothetical protein